ncbi:MAG: DUF58 domain-containing protein [Propionibacteriaceae bacterium]|jgi:uncharacterized protein (DUF58 family)|nr:DUF58 domain-containing protein [Propionibacteriaceae bacterium]
MARPHPVAAVVVLAVVAVACLLTGFAIGSGPAIGVGATVLVALVVDGLRFTLVDLRSGAPHFARTITPSPCPAGRMATVRLSLDGGRKKSDIDEFTSLAETVPVGLSGAMTVRPATSSAHQPPSILTYDLAPDKRGSYVLGPATVTRASALGLWRGVVPDTVTSSFVVWPAMVQMGDDRLARDRTGETQGLGLARPHPDNATVRAYNPGDDLKRVHWRSSARRGDLMTRAEEPVDTRHAWLGLYVPVEAVPARREMAISLGASWLFAMAQSGHVVELACAGQYRVASVEEHLLDLAEVTNAQLAAGPGEVAPQGTSLLIMVGGAARSLSAQVVARPPHDGTSRVRHGGLAVVVSDSNADADVVAQAGWEVLRLPGDTGLDQAARRVIDASQDPLVIGVRR